MAVQSQLELERREFQRVSHQAKELRAQLHAQREREQRATELEAAIGADDLEALREASARPPPPLHSLRDTITDKSLELLMTRGPRQ